MLEVPGSEKMVSKARWTFIDYPLLVNRNVFSDDIWKQG